MPQVTVSLPAGLTHPEPEHDVTVAAATVGQALEELFQLEPHLRSRVFLRGNRLLVFVLLNGGDVRAVGGLAAELADGDRLQLVPPYGGG